MPNGELADEIRHRTEEPYATPTARPRALDRHVRALLRLRVRTERYGPPRLQQHPTAARAATSWLRPVSGKRRLHRGRLRELGERVLADGPLRGAHRLSLPEGFCGIQRSRFPAPRRGRLRGGKAPRGRSLASPKGWSGAQALRKLPEHRPTLFVCVLLGDARYRGRRRLQRGGGRAQGTTRLRGRVSAHTALLVRVVPELAERVPGDRGDDSALNLPAPERLIPIQARRRPSRTDGQLAVSRSEGAGGYNASALASLHRL